MKILKHNHPFITESGASLPGLKLPIIPGENSMIKGDNVIWVCHALTANSDVESWWPGMVGEEMVFDTKEILYCLCKYSWILLWNDRSCFQKTRQQENHG